MMRDDLYTDHPAHQEVPLIDDLYEAGQVALIGFCFLMTFVLIVTLIMSRESD